MTKSQLLQAKWEQRSEKLARQMEKDAAKAVLPLLNKLQRRIKEPIAIYHCNGDTWLEVKDFSNREGRYTDVNDAANMEAYKHFGHPASSNEQRYASRFPELVEIFRIVHVLDDTRMCGFPEVHPTVKPLYK